ncbi:MAG: CitMHS family transporter [Christensenellales bacterium]|jgi:CitMHS family citrate-Mg2+:H+ or citrate-Ca2+:H+ symporter
MALTILAWVMIIVFMTLIMTKKMSPFTALIFVPLVFALIGSFMGLYSEQAMKAYESSDLGTQIKLLGDWVRQGTVKVAPTGVMLLFAIMYFSLMLNAGMFDPILRKLIAFAKGDPLKIQVAAALVAAAVSLNGDGTTTTLIVCTAFVPIYKTLKMSLMNLAVTTVLMNTIMNLLPWGGPSARVISVFPELSDAAVLNALAPGMIVAFIYMMGVAFYMGWKERKKLGITKLTDAQIEQMMAPASEEDTKLKRPHLFWVNLIMTVALVAMLMLQTFPSLTLFTVGTVLALLINYPNLKEQKNRIQDNAGDALQVVILVFGAGAFTGLFENSGMSTALAQSLADIIPTSLGNWWGLITALISAPGTFFLSNDAFYYGVLPVLSQAGVQYGYTTLELGVASLLGQAFHLLSPLVAFIYLLLEMTEQDLGEWQRKSAKWALGIFIIFIAVAAITGAVPLYK